jgi:hypothetical protein
MADSTSGRPGLRQFRPVINVPRDYDRRRKKNERGRCDAVAPVAQYSLARIVNQSHARDRRSLLRRPLGSGVGLGARVSVVRLSCGVRHISDVRHLSARGGFTARASLLLAKPRQQSQAVLLRWAAGIGTGLGRTGRRRAGLTGHNRRTMRGGWGTLRAALLLVAGLSTSGTQQNTRQGGKRHRQQRSSHDAKLHRVREKRNGLGKLRLV